MNSQLKVEFLNTNNCSTKNYSSTLIKNDSERKVIQEIRNGIDSYIYEYKNLMQDNFDKLRLLKNLGRFLYCELIYPKDISLDKFDDLLEKLSKIGFAVSRNNVFKELSFPINSIKNLMSLLNFLVTNNYIKDMLANMILEDLVIAKQNFHKKFDSDLHSKLLNKRPSVHLEDPFSKLPIEILHFILKYLQLKDLIKCSKMSTFFYQNVQEILRNFINSMDKSEPVRQADWPPFIYWGNVITKELNFIYETVFKNNPDLDEFKKYDENNKNQIISQIYFDPRISHINVGTRKYALSLIADYFNHGLKAIWEKYVLELDPDCYQKSYDYEYVGLKF